MSQPNLYAFSGVNAMAPSLRSYIIQSQSAGLASHGTFKVAVSGGSLPEILAAALLPPSAGPNDVVDFAKWEVFFADERAVPLGHRDSNYALLKTHLLDKISENQRPTVRTINTEHLNDMRLLAGEYEKTIASSFGSSTRPPMFDLVLLGCGPDGHTCSLFPGHPLLGEANAWVASINDSPKPPPKRITLTLPVVTSSASVAFVTTGEEQKDAIKRVFDANDDLPSALVNRATGNRCSWFVDEAAVEGVEFPRKQFP